MTIIYRTIFLSVICLYVLHALLLLIRLLLLSCFNLLTFKNNSFILSSNYFLEFTMTHMNLCIRLFYLISFNEHSRARQVEVIPIESATLQQAITLLFRLKYLRDVMLRPTIEDTGVSALNSMIAFTTADICSKVVNVILLDIILSCLVLSCRVLSCLVLFRFVLIYLFLSFLLFCSFLALCLFAFLCDVSYQVALRYVVLYCVMLCCVVL